MKKEVSSYIDNAAYINTYKSGELKKRLERALSLLEECRLCPRNCAANRLRGQNVFPSDEGWG